MTWPMVYVLAVVLAAVLLFISERFRADQVALAVPVALLLGGILTAEQALSGFSNQATITVAAMLILSLGLTKTGGVDAFGRLIRQAPLKSATLKLTLLTLLAAAVSPFLNNTAVVVILLPLFLALTRGARIPPSRHLLPLSYAAILGGTVTLIGTSTNLVVHGMARNRGYDALSLFSIAPLGIVYVSVGLGFLGLAGRWLIPNRSARTGLGETFSLRSFTTELEVLPGSPATVRPFGELRWGRRHEVDVIGVHRRGRDLWDPWPALQLEPGDVLYAQGEPRKLLELANREGLRTPAQHPDANSGPDVRMAEILVAPGSPLIGHTLTDLDFRRRYHVTVLAIQRDGTTHRGRLKQTLLEAGDMLLVHGAPADLETLATRRGFVPLSEIPPHRVDRPHALVALTILVAVVAVAATGLADILVAALVGVVAMLFTRCIHLDEVYAEIDWMVVFLLAGLIPLGLAMEESGTARFLVDRLVPYLEGQPPIVVVACLYLFTSLLTEVMSNNATAVLLTPIALLMADHLGMNPYAMLVTVMFGASASFMTPTGYQTNAMVFGPGGYRFSDFLRVGVPLNALLAVVASLLIPVLWPS